LTASRGWVAAARAAIRFSTPAISTEELRSVLSDLLLPVKKNEGNTDAAATPAEPAKTKKQIKAELRASREERLDKKTWKRFAVCLRAAPQQQEDQKFTTKGTAQRFTSDGKNVLSAREGSLIHAETLNRIVSDASFRRSVDSFVQALRSGKEAEVDFPVVTPLPENLTTGSTVLSVTAQAYPFSHSPLSVSCLLSFASLNRTAPVLSPHLHLSFSP
jgi:hypothetical protein